MQEIGIKAIRHVITGQQQDVQTLPERQQLEGPEAEYYDQCGVKSIYNANESSFELAAKAAQKLLDETGETPENIDLIIYIQSRVPQQFISSEATHLQEYLGAKNAWAITLSGLGCADSSSALKLAHDQLKANRRMKQVLIAYGNCQFSSGRFRYPVTIMGDAGVAALIDKTDKNILRDIQIQSNGKYWDLFGMDHLDQTAEAYTETCRDLRTYGFELAIESKNRFSDLMANTLLRQGWDKSHVHHFFMQNIASRAFQYYQDALDLNIHPICQMHLEKYGHLGAADILINLQGAIESGSVQQGQNLVIMNNSPVAAWSTIVIEA